MGLNYKVESWRRVDAARNAAYVSFVASVIRTADRMGTTLSTLGQRSGLNEGLAVVLRWRIGNPVGFREHSTPSLQGLQLLPGSDPRYPLTGAYYRRGFGTGVRRRSNGATMQIKVSGGYGISLAFV